MGEFQTWTLRLWRIIKENTEYPKKETNPFDIDKT